MMLLTLYSKPGCHLCDEALAVLEELRLEVPFELQELDISSEDSLHRAYFERIPVVTLDGEELCELRVDGEVIRKRLLA